jgi:cytochrome bd-type quinol oxidase subunit 2
VDRSGGVSFGDARFALLVVFLVVACLVVAYSAWTWRVAAADRGPRGPGSDAA